MKRALYVGLCVILVMAMAMIAGCASDGSVAASQSASASESATQSAAVSEVPSATVQAATSAGASAPVKQDTLEAAKKATGIDMKDPAYVPEGYTVEEYDVDDNNQTIEIQYTNGAQEITFIASKAAGNAIDDDLLAMQAVTQTVGTAQVQLFTAGEKGLFYGATWQSGQLTYEVDAEAGFSQDELVKMVEGFM